MWASETHHVCVAGPDGTARRERTFRHDGAGLADMAEWIAGGTAAGEVAVAIETPHGPVVESLMDRGYSVYAVNPKQLDAFGTASPGLEPGATAEAERHGCGLAGARRPSPAAVSRCSGRSS
ncbi:IS110 family transposase [Candidatus Palauibacter sp.]|uniref:IS110 family transposase n=1 Tax=Candidatus Palauibacter sp. TaxID=3101350 RepID=UPI003B524911